MSRRTEALANTDTVSTLPAPPESDEGLHPKAGSVAVLLDAELPVQEQHLEVRGSWKSACGSTSGQTVSSYPTCPLCREIERIRREKRDAKRARRTR